jgi:hypothetical protein
MSHIVALKQKGLDPASPSFKNAEPSARLDHTDGDTTQINHSLRC